MAVMRGRRTRGEWPLSCEEASGEGGRPLGRHAGQDGDGDERTICRTGGKQPYINPRTNPA